MPHRPLRAARLSAIFSTIGIALALSSPVHGQDPNELVEEIYFTRGQWGERLDYYNADDPDPLWLVAVVSGAARRNLLCVDWVDDEERSFGKECQSLPEGSASLAFESPLAGSLDWRQVVARVELGQVDSAFSLVGAYSPESQAYPVVMAPAPPPPPAPPPASEYYYVPEFPWPPPTPASSVALDRGLLAVGEETLGSVAGHLVAALGQAGYSEKSFYVVPGGFALVTRLEQIEPDGTPLPEPARWSQALPHREIFSLADFIESLFTAPVGNYRVIAFIVTDVPFSSRGELSAAEMGDLLAGGLGWLPEEVRAKTFTAGHVGTALIYQFRKVGHQGDAVLNPSDAPTAQVQLEKTGVFDLLLQ